MPFCLARFRFLFLSRTLTTWPKGGRWWTKMGRSAWNRWKLAAAEAQTCHTQDFTTCWFFKAVSYWVTLCVRVSHLATRSQSLPYAEGNTDWSLLKYHQFYRIPFPTVIFMETGFWPHQLSLWLQFEQIIRNQLQLYVQRKLASSLEQVGLNAVMTIPRIDSFGLSPKVQRLLEPAKLGVSRVLERHVTGLYTVLRNRLWS